MTTEIPLPSRWLLEQRSRPDGAPAIGEVPATVPGCTHTDLLAAGVIPDPFADTNEHAVAWVAECDWRYRTEFELDAELVAHEVLELAFEGIDTLATISLNGHVVGETSNMHRRYRFDVTDLAVAGTNSVAIDIASATRFAEDRCATHGAWPSANFGRPFNQVRKMACSWGWDWGPWLTSAGIWRTAAIVATSGGRLGDVRARPLVEHDDAGRVALAIDVSRPAPGATVRATVTDPRHDDTVVGSATAPATPGTVDLAIEVGRVARWWPHSLGRPDTYGLGVELIAADGTVLDSSSRRIGFRTIELDTSPDATGSAFTFVVNGVPMFVRGANWIPDDVFPSRIGAEDRRDRITQAIAANVDLLRVWGGGLYEDRRFYDLCDELGVLVWQDFLFACAAYPEQLLTDEVEAEARDNVSRLMSHPSLAIWCGNNENLWGHVDWGWRDELAGRSWGAGFYHELLPGVCAELDPDRPYWPGSPWSGSEIVAPNADAHGCVHVWDVWNQLDLDRYRDHTPRFVSEFGWQAPPVHATYAEAVSAPIDRSGDAWRSHQKAADGDAKLDRGIEPRFGRVDDPDAFWYAAQTVQARAVRTGIEHFRSLRPYCMGTIWWQLNDCWPVTSWAVIDGAGRTKPAWSAMRDAYRDRLLTVQPRGGELVVVAVNDGHDTWEVDGVASLIDLAGTTLAEAGVAMTVPARSTATARLPSDIVRPRDRADAVLVVDETDETDTPSTSTSASAWWWFSPDRQLRLRRPQWTVDVSSDGGDLIVDLAADVVVRDLTVHVDRLDPAATIDRHVVSFRPGRAERFRIGGLADVTADTLITRPVALHAGDLID